MKSKALILLMILTILGLLSGCENEANPKSTALETNLQPAVTLHFYMFEKEKKDTKEVLDRVAEASKLNIKLDFKWTGLDKYFRDLEVAIASNEKIDAFICGKPIPEGINFIDMFRDGKIKDLTELLPQYAPDIYKQFSEGDLNSVKVDGKIAFVPPIIPMLDCLGVNLRKDLANKYNVSSINTYNDYGIILKTIKDNEPKLIPGTFTNTMSYYDLEMFANAYGYVILDSKLALVYKWDDPNMKVIPWEQTPEFRETAGFTGEWVKNGNIAGVDSLAKVGSFAGRYSTYTEGTKTVDAEKGEKILFNNYLLYKDKKMQRQSPMSYWELSSFALSSNSENIERTLEFLNWVQSSQENYDLLIYGIQGKHYSLREERIVMPESGGESENTYYGWFSVPFLNINFLRDWDDGYDPESGKDVMIRFLNTHSSFAPHEGFYPDYRKIQADCDARINLYWEKVIAAISRGEYDTNQTDGIIEELKNAGTEWIIDETQRQLDRWRSSNTANKVE